MTAFAVLVTMTALGGCQPAPPSSPSCRYDGPVAIVGGSGLSQQYALASIAAGSNWNGSGNDAPDFVWGTPAANSVVVAEVNDPGTTWAGRTAGTSCPYRTRDITLNRAHLGSDAGSVISTAAHELGHTLGLGHDPFHDGDSAYRLQASDCGLVALMFWRVDNFTVCGIQAPTAWDNAAANDLY